MRAVRAHGSIILSTAKGSPIVTRAPASALASLRHGRLKTGKRPEVTQNAGLTGEGVAPPERVWDRVALASAWEEVTAVPLAGPGAGRVNGWRVSVEAPVAAVRAVALAVAVAEAVAVAAGSKSISHNKKS